MMIDFRQIQCPIDFSDTSARALVYAAAFAKWYEAELEILHVMAPVADAIAGSSARVAEQEEQRHTSREAVLAEMQRASGEASAAGVAFRLIALEGRPDDVIVDRARSQKADLLVMGTHGRTGFNRLLMGSVTERVVRTAPCPVLTVPAAAPAAAGGPVTFKKILCAIDHSASSLKALQYALELGRQSDGRVTVLSALEYVDPEEPCEHIDLDIRQYRQRLIDHTRERLHALIAKEPQTWCEVVEIVAINRAYKEILLRAAESDLVVMGAQGSAGIELMLYGSNTQHVVRAAVCPVLTVRAA